MRPAVLIALCTLAAVQLSTGEEENISRTSAELPESTTELLRTESRSRVARQLNIPGQEYVVRGQRQVIKVPSHARVKVVQPQQQQQQQRPIRNNRINNQNQHQNRPRQPPPTQKNRPKRGPFDEDDYYDSPEDFKTPKKPVRKTKKGYSVQDVSPEEFYGDENGEEFEYFQKKPAKPSKPSYQNQKKRYRKPTGGKQEYHYDASPQGSSPERRPAYDEETGYEFGRQRHREPYRTPAPISYFDDSGNYGYDDYQASSSITMKQVAPPNLALNVVDAPDLRKEVHSVKKQMKAEIPERYHNYPTEPTPMRKSPSTRQMQAVFPQHYTTHNPYVTRNFGLEEHERAGYYNGQSEADIHERQQSHQEYDHEQQQIPAPSEQRPVLLPTGSSGIHIVKPPQFSNVHPTVASPPNQRATIRDILLQDCPEAEAIGFCASPPRYPTQQINNIMQKCAEMMDAMYSPAPLDPEDDLSSFSSRADHDEDIQFIETESTSNSSSSMMEDWAQWSRSSSEGSNTICESSLTQTEPGYAREVTSGRWFVIMQTMDSIVQRVMTDTCDRPGKPCGGLAGLKCSRSASYRNSFKATRCVQRFTQQRLISWDPEAPHVCPKVRVFRFPTACLCHLSVD